MVGNWIWIFIPLAGILLGAYDTYVKHRQRMAMIEKGVKPEELYPHKSENMLMAGLVLIGTGVAFLLVHFWIGLTRWFTLPGFVLLFIGIALIAGYYLIRKLKKMKETKK
ncbi:MAG: DUF6249 domain-containing protein [Candidatus Aerophobetes bacterium]|nr:DUF6249 domain-containing protein [Candidatus Aerophobetes bacterium]